MSRTIDERIVSMQFKGEQFLNGINQSLQSLENFNSKLKMTEGTKGLDGVGAAAQRQSGAFSKVAESVQHVSDRFKTMGIVGITAIQNVVNKAISSGEQLVKSLTITPVLDGFHEYETKLGSIQTILANTSRYGTSLEQVNKSLNDLNHYADKTIYNFGEMTKNIGLFTNAGIRVEDATSMIKGFSNAAAASGTTAEGAAAAAYQLSQALSAGKITLMDWRSLTNVGMGNKNMQDGIIAIAQSMGTFKKVGVQAKDAQKDFNGTLEKGWLTADVMSTYLKIMAGDMDAAKMKSLGLSAAQIKTFQEQQKTAENAATKVRTFTQLVSTIKEAVGSGWSATFETIFGDFDQATTLFTKLNDTIGGFVNATSEARNKVLADWAALDGRAALLEGIGNAFRFLIALVKPIRDAFREVFPPKTGAQLAQLSFIIRNFTRNLSVSGSTADKIKRAFAGFFSIFGIAFDILKPFVAMLGRLVGVAFDGSGGFLDFAAKVGDFLVNLRQALKEGKGVENFFGKLGSLLEIPIRAIKLFGQALSNAFDKLGANKVIDGVSKISESMAPMAQNADKVATGLDKVKATLSKIWNVISGIGPIFANMGKWVANLFAGMNFGDIVKGVNTALFGGLVLMFKNWLGGGAKGGIMQNLNDSVSALTGTLKSMQLALKATALLAIALAIGILAISLNVLSKIDAAGLSMGAAAIGTIAAQLVGAMVVLDKFTSFKGAAKLPFIAASMILLGVAVLILAVALKMLASMDWETLSRGLVGVTVLMAELVAVSMLMPKGPSFVMAAASMILLSFAIRNVASAVQTLGTMSWEDMARGLVGVGVLMGAILIFINNTKVSAGGAVKGAVIYLIAAAISTLADSVKKMSGMSWGEMAKGLAMTSAGLGIISAALRSIPKGALLSAVSIFISAQALKVLNDVLMQGAGMSWESIGKGMTVMGVSLAILAIALKKMSDKQILAGAGALAIAAGSLQLLSVSLAANADLSWEQIGKGMAVMAGSLLLLTVAMMAMQKSMAGAQALITAAGALTLIGTTMKLLSSLSWTQVAIGMTVLAGVFIILGLAALILQPVIPAIYSLAIAIAMIGVAMFAAGAGVALFGAGVLLLAMGFAALAVSGVAGATALVAMIGVLIGGLPVIVQFINNLLVALIQLVIDAVPKITEAAVKIMMGMLEGMQQVAPKLIQVVLGLFLFLMLKLEKYVPLIVDAGQRMIIALLKVWKKNIGPIVDAAADLIKAFLDGLKRNIPSVADKASDVIVTFIAEIGKSASKIADAGMRMIVDFVNSLADSIRTHSEEMHTAGNNLAMAIIDGMTGGLGSGVGKVIDKAKEVAKSALDAAKNFLGIKSPSKEFQKVGEYVNDGFVKGLNGNKGDVDTAFSDLNDKISSAMQSTGEDIDNLKDKLNKLTSARKKDKKAIADTRAELAQAQQLYGAEQRALDQINYYLNDRHSRLGQLADQQDAIAAKLDDATKSLDDAIKTRDDYNKQITDQYDTLPDISGEDSTLAGYVADLRKQIEDTQKFATAIQKLRDLGLNDELYKELLSKGPQALPFINDVLASGKDGVNELNKLTGQLGDVAGGLGSDTSKELYQAGVDAAQGLVDGLKSQYNLIEAEMNAIAKSMVAAIKDALGIKSPSREFKKVGSFAADGLAEGLRAATPQVEKISTYMGKKAIKSLSESLSIMPDILSGMDSQPVIRPVLDLSEVRKGFGAVDKMTLGRRISVGAAFSNAKDVSAGYNTNSNAEAAGATANLTELNYTQNNYSPKALTAAQIYRQTNNQLSVTKGALARANPSGS